MFITWSLRQGMGHVVGNVFSNRFQNFNILFEIFQPMLLRRRKILPNITPYFGTAFPQLTENISAFLIPPDKTELGVSVCFCVCVCYSARLFM